MDLRRERRRLRCRRANCRRRGGRRVVEAVDLQIEAGHPAIGVTGPDRPPLGDAVAVVDRICHVGAQADLRALRQRFDDFRIVGRLGAEEHAIDAVDDGPAARFGAGRPIADRGDRGDRRARQGRPPGQSRSPVAGRARELDRVSWPFPPGSRVPPVAAGQPAGTPDQAVRHTQPRHPAEWQLTRLLLCGERCGERAWHVRIGQARALLVMHLTSRRNASQWKVML